MARKLSLNSRYLDDIAVINYLGFGAVAKFIYNSSLSLEESDFGYHYDHFLDLNIRIINNKFVIGIYHKVDDFDFEVISFPFPSSNISSQLGYTSFYSQLVRYFYLCNNLTDFIVRVKMLKNKLSSRGYRLVTLQKYFRKFCLVYPAPLKYGPTDVQMWELTEGNVFGSSCWVYDENAIKNITKPCTVRLKNLNYIDEGVDKRNTNIPVSNKFDIIQNDVINVLQSPISLANPRNHCYLNSVLQVLFRLKDILFQDLLVNNNSEGNIVHSLSNSLQSRSESEMANFKSHLSQYDQFFDGVVQRDAYECFQQILSILHEGTKHSILSSDGDHMDDDEEFITSITKSYFTFILKKTLTCMNCNKVSVLYNSSLNLNIYPSNLKNIQALILETMKSTIQKSCICSSDNTNHSEVLEFEELPKIFFIIVNRYSIDYRLGKNDSLVVINNEMNMNGRVFDHMATIYHHGYLTSSGHYTAKLSYTDTCYICDDHNVSTTDNLDKEQSKSCYIIFYTQRSGV